MDSRNRGPELDVLVLGDSPGHAAAVRAARGCRLLGMIPDPSPRDDRIGRADAVVVASPLVSRGGLIRRALESGKPVLSAALLDEDEGEARDLCDLADGLGVRLAASLPHRFEVPIRDFLGLSRDGRIGRVEGLRIEIGVGPGRPMLTACDLARLVLGEVTSCSSQAGFALLRNRERAAAEVRAVVGDPAPVLDVLGTEGYLRLTTGRWRLSGRIRGGGRIRGRYRGTRIADRWSGWTRGCPAALIREIEAFARPERSPWLASGWDACRIGEIVAALAPSAWLDQEIPLRPLPARTPSARRGTSVRERNG
ncbi:MAG: hypothetical protein U0800_01375 [Isosphaeraceae bacterium]